MSMETVSYEFTGDSSSFRHAVSGAAQELRNLGAEARKVKDDISATEKQLESAQAEFGENSDEVKKLADKLAQLKGKELDLQNAIKKTTDGLEANTKAAKSSANGIKDAFNMVKALAVGYAGKTLYQALIGTNAQYEQYMTSFEVLLGSAEKAEGLMSNLEKFGAETPLELSDITTSTKQLLAFGVAEDEVVDKLRQLGDIAQGQPDILDRVTNAYGKMLAKGKVSLEELNMLTEAGVPILKELQDILGVSREDLFDSITAGTITVKEIDKALDKLTGTGGQFFGMMEKQSQTFEGRISTLQDNLNMLGRQVGEEAFDILKVQLNDILTGLENLDPEMVKEFGQSIANVITFVVRLVGVLYEMRGAIMVGVGAFAGLKISMMITGVINACVIGFTTLKKAQEAGTLATNLMKAANDRLKLSLVATPWGALAAVIGLVAGALVAYTVSANSATAETDLLAKKVDQMKEAYSSAIKSIDDSTSSQLAEVEIVKQSAKVYEQLGDKTKKTKEEKQKLKKAIKDLEAYFPDLDLKINNTTKAYNKQKDKIYELIRAKSKLIEAEAWQDKAKEAAKSKVDAEISRKEAKRNFDAAEDEYYTLLTNRPKVPVQTTYDRSSKPVQYEYDQKVNAAKKKFEEAMALYNNFDGQVNKFRNDMEECLNKSEKLSKGIKKSGKDDSDETSNSDSSSSKDKDKKKKKKKTREDRGNEKIEDLDYKLKVGKVNEEKYYRELEKIRDKYFKKNSKAWRSATVELYNYRKEQDAKELEKNEKKYDKKLEKNQYALDTDVISEKEYYKRLEKNRDKYLKKNSQTWKEATLELYNWKKSQREKEQEEIEAATDRYISSINEQADAARQEINDYFDALEEAEEKQERSKTKAELEAIANQYANATTKEGMDKYISTLKEIEQLNKEDRQALLDAERQTALDKVDQMVSIKEADIRALGEQMQTSTEKAIINAFKNGSITGLFASLVRGATTGNQSIKYQNTINVYDPQSASILAAQIAPGSDKFLGG